MSDFARALALVAGLLLTLPAFAVSAAFINPGRHDEIYWLTATHATEKAAQYFGITLEVRFAERDHLKALEIAHEIAACPPEKRRPYVIFSNDYGTGPEVLRILDTTGIRSIMAYSGISTPAERAVTGGPRERYKTWLGSIEPQAEDAGYLTARALIDHGRAAKAFGADQRLHLIAIRGDRSTPTSVRRGEGMRRAVAEAPDVVLDQEVFAGWNREKAAAQAAVLFQRHPKARLIWAGNDLMAFGAMQAWEKRGGAPGGDAWFGGINTSREALEALKSVRLTALAGGHFIAGASAVVLIHDYTKGKDFADEGLELNHFMFTLLTPDDADRFLARFADLRFDQVDFQRFSKVQNPKLKRYDFSFLQLLQ